MEICSNSHVGIFDDEGDDGDEFVVEWDRRTRGFPPMELSAQCSPLPQQPTPPPFQQQLPFLQAALPVPYHQQAGQVQPQGEHVPLIQQPSEGSNHQQHQNGANLQLTEHATNILVKDKCSVCWQSEKSHAFVPCDHLCICSTCAELDTHNKRCAICGNKATQVVRIFS